VIGRRSSSMENAAHDRWRSAKSAGGLVWREPGGWFGGNPTARSLDDETFSDSRLQLEQLMRGSFVCGLADD